MTVQELRAFKVDLLDEINTLANEPVPNTDEIREQVESLFAKLEAEIGKETRTSSR